MRKPFFRLIIPMLLSGLFAATVGIAEPQSSCPPLRILDQGWEYRWGDSPFDAQGNPEWVQDGADAWQPIASPSNPPDRGDRQNVWYRVRLPASDRDATRECDLRLFVYSIDIVAHFYVGDRLIYASGALDDAGRGSFQGWPYHLIDLPSTAWGEYLYVRVFSDYHDIGLWGTVWVGPALAQVQRIYRRDLPRLLVGVVSVLMGLVFLCAFVLERNRLTSLHLALVLIFIALRLLAQTHVKQLLLDTPVFWEYLLAGTSFAIPVLITLFLRQVLEGRFHRITTAIVVAVSVLFVGAMTASLSGLVGLVYAYRIYDVITVAVMVLLAALFVVAGRSGDTEARLVTVNFIIMAVLTAYSTLVSHGVLPWTDDIDYLIGFQFSLGLGVVLVRRFLLIQRNLASMNVRLERMVTDRTRDLQEANRRLTDEKRVLHVVSITDALTGLYNRMYILDRLRNEAEEARRYGKELSIVMFDVDRFKDVNDTLGHQAGDRALQNVAKIFEETLRDSDLAGRYGGEEFLLVLPQTGSAEAVLVAERIRQRVRDMTIPDHRLHITLSGGVAQFHDEEADELLHRADELLYEAKKKGRDRIEAARE